MGELDKMGLSPFVAEYVEFAIGPLYDSDESCLDLRTSQGPELVRIAPIILGMGTVEKVRVPRERDWRVAVLAEDEIPF